MIRPYDLDRLRYSIDASADDDDDDLSDVEGFGDEDDIEELDQCSHGVSFDDVCDLCDEEWEGSDDESDDDTDDEGEDDDALYAR